MPSSSAFPAVHFMEPELPTHFQGSQSQSTPPTSHIPRPRNAFMIFRSEFSLAKINGNVEHDNRHISRIIAHCWNSLSPSEKEPWHQRAEQEKLEHHRRNPGYRYKPSCRVRKTVKRNVSRNGEKDLLRCRQVADLIMAGKDGQELETAVKSVDKILEYAVPDITPGSVFRSPLLPPAEVKSPAVTPEPNVTTTNLIHRTSKEWSHLSSHHASQDVLSTTYSMEQTIYSSSSTFQEVTCYDPCCPTWPLYPQSYAGHSYDVDGAYTTHYDYPTDIVDLGMMPPPNPLVAPDIHIAFTDPFAGPPARQQGQYHHLAWPQDSYRTS